MNSPLPKLASAVTEALTWHLSFKNGAFVFVFGQKAKSLFCGESSRVTLGRHLWVSTLQEVAARLAAGATHLQFRAL